MLKKLSCFLLVIALSTSSLFTAQPQPAHAADRKEVALPTAHDEFSFTTAAKNQYAVEYTINAKAVIEESRKSGCVKITIDYSGSSFSVSNQTEGKKTVPGLAAQVYPAYRGSSDTFEVYSSPQAVASVDNDTVNDRYITNLSKFGDYYGQMTGDDLNGGTFSMHASANCDDDGEAKLEQGASRSYLFTDSSVSVDVAEGAADALCNNLVWVVVIYETFNATKTMVALNTLTLDENATVQGKCNTLGDGDYLLSNPFLATKSSGTTTGHETPSGGGGGDKRSVVYTPQGAKTGVEITFQGGDELFTTQSYDSLKNAAAIFAKSEMRQLEEWLTNDLGFENAESFDLVDGSGILGFDTTSGVIGHKTMDDGRTLLYIWLNGTKGISILDPSSYSEWISNLLNSYGIFHDDGGLHDGFNQAAKAVESKIAEYMSAPKHVIDPNNTFFSFGGYSRGAGVAEILASRDTLNGVKLSEQNCMAYTFGTPDTIHSGEPGNHSWITAVVSEKDPIDHILGWSKQGKTVGYPTYDQSLIDNAYGEDVIGSGNWFRGHMPGNYIANVANSEPVEIEKSHRQKFANWAASWFECPTNVRVMHNGELAASVINNAATNYDPDVYITTNDARQKKVIMPDDGERQIIIEATDDGTMDVSSDILGDSSPQADFVTYNIIKDQFYEFDIETGRVSEYDMPPSSSFASVADVIFPAIIAVLVGGMIVLKVESKRRRNK
jgi:hypothetical protein